MIKSIVTLILAAVLSTLAGCDQDRINELKKQNKELTAKLQRAPPDDVTYTLYRSSPFGPGLRIHVATFDSTTNFDTAADNKDYNHEMCKDARSNFTEKNRDGLIKFWCEEGHYRAKLPQGEAIHEEDR